MASGPVAHAAERIEAPFKLGELLSQPAPAAGQEGLPAAVARHDRGARFAAHRVPAGQRGPARFGGEMLCHEHAAAQLREAVEKAAGNLAAISRRADGPEVLTWPVAREAQDPHGSGGVHVERLNTDQAPRSRAEREQLQAAVAEQVPAPRLGPLRRREYVPRAQRKLRPLRPQLVDRSRPFDAHVRPPFRNPRGSGDPLEVARPQLLVHRQEHRRSTPPRSLWKCAGIEQRVAAAPEVDRVDAAVLEPLEQLALVARAQREPERDRAGRQLVEGRRHLRAELIQKQAVVGAPAFGGILGCDPGEQPRRRDERRARRAERDLGGEIESARARPAPDGCRERRHSLQAPLSVAPQDRRASSRPIQIGLRRLSPHQQRGAIRHRKALEQAPDRGVAERAERRAICTGQHRVRAVFEEHEPVRVTPRAPAPAVAGEAEVVGDQEQLHKLLTHASGLQKTRFMDQSLGAHPAEAARP